MSGDSVLMEIYERLLSFFGPRHWWPAKTPFEMIAGAVLTQNTAWGNVERAINNLKREKSLRVRAIYEMDLERLANLVVPAGYYNVKAWRLKNFVNLLVRDYRGSLKRFLRLPLEELRAKLLAINGIGQETADCILLYAAGHPVFVVDSYTRRVLERHRLIAGNADYSQVQTYMEARLPEETKLFNEYHALLVEVGKRFCRRVPRCRGCPLEYLL